MRQREQRGGMPIWKEREGEREREREEATHDRSRQGGCRDEMSKIRKRRKGHAMHGKLGIETASTFKTS